MPTVAYIQSRGGPDIAKELSRLLADTAPPKHSYLVHITGCDDVTELAIDLDPDELATVQRLAAASRDASEYGCQPKIEVQA